MVEVTLVSDQPVVAAGVRVMLRKSHRVRVSRRVGTLQEAAELRPANGDEILLIDVASPLDLNLLRDVCRHSSHRVCLFAHGISPELFYQAREAGVAGVLCTSRPAEEIVDAICAMSEGQLFFDPLLQESGSASRAIHLTPREGHLIELLTQGLKNKEIAYQLGITEGTVKVYLSKLFQKVGAKDRFELALSGLKNLGLTSMLRGTQSAEPASASPEGIRTLVTRIPPATERRRDRDEQAG